MVTLAAAEERILAMPRVALIAQNIVLTTDDDLDLDSSAPVASRAAADVIPLRAVTEVYARGAALYLAAGYSPFPLPAGQKRPPPEGWTGRDALMATQAQVQEWCTQSPDGNIALRLPPGVIGIDVDAYKGEAAAQAWAELSRRLGPLPPAPWCSARNDGLSGVRLFRVPEGYVPSDRGMGLAGEVIWHGYRYVVAPPSVHPDTGRIYRWLEPKSGLADAVKAANLPMLPSAWLEALRTETGGSPNAAVTGWTSPDIPRLLANGIPPGVVQDEVLRDVALTLAVEGRSEEEARGVWQAIVDQTTLARPSEPWTEAGFRRHWGGALRTLQEPTEAEVAGEVKRLRMRERARQAIAAESTMSAALMPVDWQAAWDGHKDEPDWLVEPVIERGQTVSMWAAPGTGKSLLALEIAAALASGKAVLGNPPRKPVTILYLDCENRRPKLLGRLRDMGHSAGELDRLKLLSFPAMAKLDTAAGGAQVLSQVQEHTAVLVVIDTMSRVIAGDENDARTFTEFYSHTIEPLRGAGVALFLLDHPGKDITRGTRGSSAKLGHVDVEWELAKDGLETFSLKAIKDRDGQVGAPLVLRRLTAPLRHVPTSPVTKTQQTVEALDRFAAPIDISRRDAAALLREHHLRVGTGIIQEAVNFRKNRPPVEPQPNVVGPHSEEDLFSGLVPESADQATADSPH
jgi:hypothetical protein